MNKLILKKQLKGALSNIKEYEDYIINYPEKQDRFFFYELFFNNDDAMMIDIPKDMYKQYFEIFDNKVIIFVNKKEAIKALKTIRAALFLKG